MYQELMGREYIRQVDLIPHKFFYLGNIREFGDLIVIDD